MRSKASAGVYKKAQKNAKLTANSGPLQKALLSMDAFNLTLLFMAALGTRWSRKSKSFEKC